MKKRVVLPLLVVILGLFRCCGGASVRTSAHGRNLIIGGHDVDKGRYPYYVSLDYRNGVVLSAALIAPDIVLTAGHCLANTEIPTIRIGTYSLSQNATIEPVQIVNTTRHPEWKQEFIWTSEHMSHDVALYKVTPRSSVPPVKINRDDAVPEANQKVVVFGLGWTQQSPSQPDIVQEASLNAMSNEQCALSNDPEGGMSYEGQIDETMLCTSGGPNNERDACGWDSGDPIIVPSEDGDPTKDFLVGLASWGIGCANPFFPGVQARVSGVADWIDAQVCALSDDPPKDFECEKKSTKVHATTTKASTVSPTAPTTTSPTISPTAPMKTLPTTAPTQTPTALQTAVSAELPTSAQTHVSNLWLKCIVGAMAVALVVYVLVGRYLRRTISEDEGAMEERNELVGLDWRDEREGYGSTKESVQT